MAYFWTEIQAMKRLAVLWGILMVTSSLVQAQSEIFNPMKDAIKGSDAAALVKSFAQSVDINIEGTITYNSSKAQSELILKEFFKKHPVESFNHKHSGSSQGGLQFTIYTYVSGADSYTVLMRAREVDKKYLVHEISFIKE